ncbi:hypothetical protein niasHS_006339 [Heterodera schachtii]|uniref:Uncharacterized protein n=1 Tax=Heterodera schachtii TaxID=97005 RepID=A0ABD2JX55_HETSC
MRKHVLMCADWVNALFMLAGLDSAQEKHMSSITSSNTDSDRYSSWREMPPNCEHKEGNFVVERVQIRRHRMMSNELHSVLSIRVCRHYASCGAPFLLVQQMPANNLLPHCRFFIEGKTYKMGEIPEVHGILMDAPFYIPSPMLSEIFGQMHGSGYSVTSKNCQHWSLGSLKKQGIFKQAERLIDG